MPLSCTCTVYPDGSLMIKAFEPSTDRIKLLVAAVATENLTSSREIANLIGELRSEMSSRKTAFH
ncbi:DUF1652 domain-containing protein [Pseudomonas umsongensis]|uniref:DUF1652 domain-containing protein n=1 Tax=Pseudomonas umsongensis TaxID=198618 RepID=UPI00200B0812|nr:DUF1652 domain-containing protein [Pseudomonas umsongensis]MCK8682747.1 DUF1652 domain-containing protein [Pseudomonas umsongensis]